MPRRSIKAKSYTEAFYAVPTRRDGTPYRSDAANWIPRHMAACRGTPGRLAHDTGRLMAESAIRSLILAWLQYADTHWAMYDSGIGEDSVLGPAWEAIGRQLRNLLNGECGRFDCITLDGLILDVLASEGYREE